MSPVPKLVVHTPLRINERIHNDGLISYTQDCRNNDTWEQFCIVTNTFGEMIEYSNDLFCRSQQLLFVTMRSSIIS